jgi:glycosyltransferase involved in cell wall biosynthesis
VRVVKLIVQIPCFNEEETLGLVVRSIPRVIPGIDEVRVLIVDDGSTDRTVEVARELGVDYIVRHRRNLGLAAAFRTGLEACLRLRADIVVNTDGDNQYPQNDIPRLIQPILNGEADMVVADRQIDKVPHFSPRKKQLQKVGSWTVRRFSGSKVVDAPSGFRAFTRDVATRLNVMSTYSYTLDTVIQAGRNGMAIANVPVVTNAKTRESRLFRSTFRYLARSAGTIVRVYAMYEPLTVFLGLGLAVMLVGMAVIARWLFFFAQGDGQGHVQSLILAAALLIIGFQVCMMGLLADLTGANRRLLEQLLYRQKRSELGEPVVEIEQVAAHAGPTRERSPAEMLR